jgi:hypothetical protein
MTIEHILMANFIILIFGFNGSTELFTEPIIHGTPPAYIKGIVPYSIIHGTPPAFTVSKF